MEVGFDIKFKRMKKGDDKAQTLPNNTENKYIHYTTISSSTLSYIWALQSCANPTTRVKSCVWLGTLILYISPSE